MSHHNNFQPLDVLLLVSLLLIVLMTTGNFLGV